PNILKSNNIQCFPNISLGPSNHDNLECWLKMSLPVHHQLPEFTQTHAHRVGDAIQTLHPLLSPSPPGAISSKEWTSQILTGLIFHPLFAGAILPTSQTNPDAQNGILPAGQAGANPVTQGTPEDPFSAPSGTDDDLAVTTPAGIQRGRQTTEETPTASPKGIQ
ncbi:hypothetical protein FD754_019889, partial [Muntiacus muntjak]